MLHSRDEVVVLVTSKRVGVGSAESQLSSLDVLHAHSLPVEKIAQTLGTVSLVDALTTTLSAKVKHVRGELINRVVDALGTAVYNVDTVIARVLDELLHVASETRQVGGDAGNTHDGTLGRSVSPGLVV